MFGKVISIIVTALLPVYYKLFFFNPVTDPVETHVNGFASFLANRVVGNAHCTGVISLNRCGWLWVTQVTKGGP